ncbi:MAG TPA: GNAT family N-acetyltransferase [Roseomonas sp.]|jgi:DNA-binding MarR family transcriptional regulator/predicted N-acetyltransferase YhbS
MADVLRRNPHLFLGSRLKRLAEQMQADASAFTQRAGVSVPPGMFAVLATLDELGPVTVGRLAEAMGVSQPAMTKNIGKLASAALVKAGRSKIDKRHAVVDLTGEGRAAIAEGREHIWPLVDAAVHDLTHGLSGSLIEQLDEIEHRMSIRSLSDRAAAKAAVTLRPALDADVPALVQLLNRAYRGSDSDASWNTEAAYMDGDRTDAALLRGEIAEKPQATLLVWELWGALQGSVWLEPLGGDAWYLGSLAVDPSLQNAQAGRRLLAASESWVRARGGRRIRMTVVNARDTLIAWYERRGYRLTGETEPFPYDDGRFGTPKRPDLHFVVMSKAFPEAGGD